MFSGLTQSEIPYVNIQIIIKGGHLMDYNHPQKTGLAILTARLMNEGTATMQSDEFEAALDKIGSTITVSSDAENTYINVGTLRKNLDATLALLQEKLLYPALGKPNLEEQQMEGINNSLISTFINFNRCFSKMIGGEK